MLCNGSAPANDWRPLAAIGIIGEKNQYENL